MPDVDNLLLDMRQCEKDGYGPHYGKWKAAGGSREKSMEKAPVKKKKPEKAEELTRICGGCGQPFPMIGRHGRSKYCNDACKAKAMAKRRIMRYHNEVHSNVETVAE